MRRLLIVPIAATALSLPAMAQDSVIAVRPQDPAVIGVRRLPRDVAEEVIRFFNAPGTLTFSGITRVPAARGIDGDVGVVGGPVIIAGGISGDLMVINGDVTFEQGARVSGSVLVVGGSVDGENQAQIGGELRVYREALYFRRSADTLVYAPTRNVPWRRPARHWSDPSDAGFVVAFGGTFNRVEGAPILLGPRLDVRMNSSARLLADARLILRTAESFSLKTGRFGYRAKGELMLGSRAQSLSLGVRGYDQVHSIEPWPLKDFEAGWAAFLMHDDYRDWYRRRGGAAYATLRPSRALSLTVEGRAEDHLSVSANDPWSIFDNSAAWRINPAISDGRYRALGTTFRVDTRNDRSAPTSGVMLSGEFEAARGTGVSMPTCSGPSIGTLPCDDDGRVSYTRAFVDARTYLRLTREARLNLRVAGGGKLGGEQLPLQHRMSLGFPDPLPGYAFRQLNCGGSASVSGCDRAVVVQAEFRTHLGFDFGPDWANDWGDEDPQEHWRPFHISGPDIVVFADAGRAWNVDGPGALPSSKLPAISSFSTDLGLGLDFGPIGFYLAKSVGALDQSATFSVRLGRRF